MLRIDLEHHVATARKYLQPSTPLIKLGYVTRFILLPQILYAAAQWQPCKVAEVHSHFVFSELVCVAPVRAHALSVRVVVGLKLSCIMQGISA